MGKKLNTVSPTRYKNLPKKMARPEGLEPPTTWFEARYSIQLSYGRALGVSILALDLQVEHCYDHDPVT